jgi:hypothetical protein
MDKEKVKKQASEFNNYILSLSKEDQNDFLYRMAKEFEINIPTIQNFRYGTGRINKLKRDRIEQIAGKKIFFDEKEEATV